MGKKFNSTISPQIDLGVHKRERKNEDEYIYPHCFASLTPCAFCLPLRLATQVAAAGESSSRGSRRNKAWGREKYRKQTQC
jgi:hypothetical protein